MNTFGISKKARPAILLVGISLMSACATINGSGDQAPPKNLENLKIKPGPKKVVSIYQFRSQASRLSGKTATDMFTTALVNSKAFAVVERQQLAKGVKKEKKLQNKEAIGTAGSSKLMGVDYIFEGAVSEFTPDEEKNEYGMSLGGMQANRAQNDCGIGIDVRIIEAGNGQVIDSVNVRRMITRGERGISGIGNLLRSVSRTGGSGLDPDINIKKSKIDGIERTLRDCIQDAVYELVKRYAAE